MAGNVDLRVNAGSSIVKAIKSNASGDSQKNRRIMLLAGGGGTAGIYGAGVMAGLEELNLADAFHSIVGVSAGAINSAFFCARQAQMLNRIYIDDFIKCINICRPWKIYDMETVKKIILARLSVKEALNSKAQLYAAVTDVDSGKGYVVNVKNERMVDFLLASSSPPVGFNSSVKIDGRKFIDGEIGAALPILEACELCLPTHVLVILNRPYGQTRPSLPSWQKNLMEIFMSMYTPSIRSNYANWDANFAYNLQCLDSLAGKICVGVVSPDGEISEISRNGLSMERIFNNAKSDIVEIFS